MKIGVDLTTISRFKDKEEKFKKKLLNKEEIQEYEESLDKTTFIAVHWAFKEALFKALNSDDYNNYVLLHAKTGQPYVKDHPEISVSISHEKDLVIVFIVVNK